LASCEVAASGWLERKIDATETERAHRYAILALIQR
jgi:hypothetical protein